MTTIRNRSSEPRTGFVLSAGRTGTVFLSRLLAASFPKTVVVHEPFPARIELLLGNFRNETGLGEALLRYLCRAARTHRLSKLPNDHAYIEINPMLCPHCDLLPQLTDSLSIVHIVREPLSWARSIVTFRASRAFRDFIDFVPFTKPYPTPRPKGWRQLSEMERALWRWRFCNEQILSLRSHCRSYQMLRYEDLFAAEAERRDAALRKLFVGLPVDFDGRMPNVNFNEKSNQKPAGAFPVSVSESIASAICGDLMDRFGYAGQL